MTVCVKGGAVKYQDITVLFLCVYIFSDFFFCNPNFVRFGNDQIGFPDRPSQSVTRRHAEATRRQLCQLDWKHTFCFFPISRPDPCSSLCCLHRFPPSCQLVLPLLAALLVRVASKRCTSLTAQSQTRGNRDTRWRWR